jgi:hypothetical protein
MMKNKQTAVEWLVTELEGEESLVARIVGLKEYNQIVKKAKQMEKEQIMKAFSRNYMYPDDIPASEKYYNETYGK